MNYLLTWEIGTGVSVLFWAIAMIVNIGYWHGRKNEYPHPSIAQREEIFDAARDIVKVTPFILLAPIWPLVMVAGILAGIFFGTRQSWRATNQIRAHARGELT